MQNLKKISQDLPTTWSKGAPLPLNVISILSFILIFGQHKILSAVSSLIDFKHNNS